MPPPSTRNPLCVGEELAPLGSSISYASFTVSWKSTSREAVLAEIAEALNAADETVRAAWERIRCEPERWQCSPWGDAGGGFWVVAKLPSRVVWYNDIEDGFNVSPAPTQGVIGSYLCNQTRFAEFLARLPEAKAAEAFAEGRADESTPTAVAGRGRIGRRQTTYWDLHADEGGVARAHFSGKQEARFVAAEYDRVILAGAHPLLLDYEQPWRGLFVTNARGCGPLLVHEIEIAVRVATHGWRRASEYLGAVAAVLSHGNGLLLRAPATIASRVAEVVRNHGATTSLLDDCPARAGYRALLMGPNFIVARAFRFEFA